MASSPRITAPMNQRCWIEFSRRKPRMSDCPSGYVLVWHVFQGTMVIPAARVRPNPMYSHWMRVPEDGWIDKADRLPSAEDGDAQNCVLIQYDEDGIVVSGWHRFQRDRFCRAWQRTPPPP